MGKHNYYVNGVQCYIDDKTYHLHREEILWLVKHINCSLKGENGYNGFNLIDVNAGGIQISMKHADVDGYVFGPSATIKYDWSNLQEAADDVIEAFKESNNEKYIKYLKEFVAYGEKYGWD